MLYIYIRMIFPDMLAKEEFLATISLKEQTHGTDIYNIF